MARNIDDLPRNPLPPLPVLEGPRRFQAAAIKRGIDFYLKTGGRVNTAYTPANMKRTAENITGRKYPAGRNGLTAAHADLEEMTK
jgi:hypothetical protein